MNILITLNDKNKVVPITNAEAKLAVYNSERKEINMFKSDDLNEENSSIFNVVKSNDIEAVVSYNYNRMGLTFFRVNQVTPYLAQERCDVFRNLELFLDKKLEEATVANLSSEGGCSSSSCSTCSSVSCKS